MAADDLGEVVTDIVQARTHRAGSMLRMFGIGYVVVRPGADAGRLVDLVAEQQDLDAKPTEQAALFAGPGVPQTAWVIPGETPPAEVQAMLTSPAQPDPIPDPATGKVEASGPGTVVLLVPEAEVAGRRRRGPAGADHRLGWAQGFKLPAGTTGELEVSGPARSGASACC